MFDAVEQPTCAGLAAESLHHYPSAMGKSKNVGPANIRFIPRGAAGEKVCSRCRRSRPIDHFKIDKSRFDGRGYICASCRDGDRSAPGPTRRERKTKAAIGLKWCRGCSHWLDQVHAGRCRPCANSYARQLYASNPSFREARSHRASARRRNVAVVPVEAREMILEEFGGTCAYCSAPATTWDHVVAVTKGGLTEPYNMVPACGPCNSSKRTQNVWAWLKKTGRPARPELIDRLLLFEASLLPARGPDPLED